MGEITTHNKNNEIVFTLSMLILYDVTRDPLSPRDSPLQRLNKESILFICLPLWFRRYSSLMSVPNLDYNLLVIAYIRL